MTGRLVNSIFCVADVFLTKFDLREEESIQHDSVITPVTDCVSFSVHLITCNSVHMLKCRNH